MAPEGVESRLNLGEALACLDCLPQGVLRVDGEGRIAYSNAAADQMLRSADGLCRREATLEASSPQDDVRLRALFQWAGAVEGAPAVPLVMTVSRPSGQLSYQIRAHRPGVDGGADSAPPGRFTLFVEDPADPRVACEDCLRTMYRLTASEAATAHLIALGLDVQQVASRRGVSVQTTRTQLKQVFIKTGVNRQSDLVRVLVLASVGACTRG